MGSRHRYAVVECATISQAYDPHDYICGFDLPQEHETSGTIRECLRYIARQEVPTDYLIVHLKEDDTFTIDDIVWRPFDRASEELLTHYLRKRQERPLRIVRDPMNNTASSL